MTAYHKTFGQIEVLSKDNTTTTIVILSTGEEKKLLNKFANALISDKPFVKAKKSASKKIELTEEQKEIVAISVAKEINEQFFINGLSREQKIQYKASKSKRIHLS